MHGFNILVLFAPLLIGQQADLHLKPRKDASKQEITVANGRAEAARELREARQKSGPTV